VRRREPAHSVRVGLSGTVCERSEVRARSDAASRALGVGMPQASCCYPVGGSLIGYSNLVARARAV
jgi:hypothetical protein